MGNLMRRYAIAAIPADGIGPEVIDAGLEVLEALGRRAGDLCFDVTRLNWGSDYYKAQGTMMPDDGLDQLKSHDAIYFGAVGAPDIADHITLWGLRLRICQGLDQYANVRPTRILPGISAPLRGKGPGDLDWVMVRENSEGEYAGHGGRSHRGLPQEIATEVAVFTRTGVTRIMRRCVPAGPIPAPQAPDSCDQIKCSAARHGDVGRDRSGNRSRVSRRGLG
jgi:tartrate dehydrogenase/decarboxylase/D-malate dehydrogenase